MNSANQNLEAIRNKKALITKKYNEAKERLETRYAEDMAILNNEEKNWLKQFKDIPPIIINHENNLMDLLAEKEYEQWCHWSKGLSKDYKKLISLIPLEELPGADHDFVVKQLDRIDRWQKLWDSDYSEISDDLKEIDYHFATIAYQLCKTYHEDV